MIFVSNINACCYNFLIVFCENIEILRSTKFNRNFEFVNRRKSIKILRHNEITVKNYCVRLSLLKLNQEQKSDVKFDEIFFENRRIPST